MIFLYVLLFSTLGREFAVRTPFSSAAEAGLNVFLAMISLSILGYVIAAWVMMEINEKLVSRNKKRAYAWGAAAIAIFLYFVLIRIII